MNNGDEDDVVKKKVKAANNTGFYPYPIHVEDVCEVTWQSWVHSCL